MSTLLETLVDSIIEVNFDPIFEIIFDFMIVLITTINNLIPHTLLDRVSFAFCITLKSTKCSHIESGVEQTYINFIFESKHIFYIPVN